MGNLVEVDLAAWPLVIVRMPRALDMPAIDSFIRGIDPVLERKEKFSTIIDTTALSRLPNPVERHAFIDQMNKRAFAEKAHNLGNAVIIVSAPARTVLTAINWIRPPVVPQQLFRDFPDALEWSVRRLAAAYIALTPAIEALRVRPGAARGG